MIMEKVVLKEVDLRGSKFLRPDFGNCCFYDVKFTRGNFLIEWLSAFLTVFFTKRNIMRFRRFLKKILYKCRIGKVADKFSATDFQNNIEYKAADFSKEYHLCWYIQDMDFLRHFKRKHRVLAPFTFLTSNYMRSFGALLFFSSFIVWVFSLAYSTNLVKFEELPPDYSLLFLSAKIFTNFGTDPFDAQNSLTQILVIAEIILGYFALGTLLSIILFPFARRTSLPTSNKKKDD